MDRQNRGSSRPAQHGQFSRGRSWRSHQDDGGQQGNHSHQRDRPGGSGGQSSEPYQSSSFHQRSTEVAHRDEYRRGDYGNRSFKMGKGDQRRKHQDDQFHEGGQRGHRSHHQQSRAPEGQWSEPNQSTSSHQRSTEVAHRDAYGRGGYGSRSSFTNTRGRGRGFEGNAGGNFQGKPREFSGAVSKSQKPNMKERDIMVYTNHFVIEKLGHETAYHYYVTFEPDRPKRLFTLALEQFRDKHFRDFCLNFDGKQNLYVSEKLPFHQDKIIKDSVTVYNEERKREEKFTITIKFIAEVDLSVINQQCLQVLDIIIGSGAAAKSRSVGRGYYPPITKQHYLGGGFELRSGLFLSVKHGDQLMVNFDVCNKVFLRSQSVLDLIKELCRGDLPESLDKRTLETLKNVLLRSKVKYTVSGDLDQFIGVFNVWEILSSPVKLSFELESKVQVTVLEYFEKHKNTPVKYKNLPCLNLRNQKPMYVPLEFCYITEGQAVHIDKLNPAQSTAMIKQTATSTFQRMKAITDMLNWFNLNRSLQARVFDFKISMNFLQTVAHILVPPTIEYRNNSVVPCGGRWSTPAQFIKGSILQKWAVLYIQRSVSLADVTRFVDLFINHGNKLGMKISKPLYNEEINSRKIEQGLEFFIEKYKDYDIIFVIGVDFASDIYSCAKITAEAKIKGVLTQCIKAQTILVKCEQKIAKIVEKVNKKLGGTNNTLHKSSSPIKFVDCMFVGADVTHPTPKDREMPSVAAVCASCDETGSHYGAQIRLQRGGKEIIEDLQEMMVCHLKSYEKNMQKLPRCIFFFRDGVGDGDFETVSQKEVVAVQKACYCLSKDYKPDISFVIVQKRHHIRFFPTKDEDKVGKQENVPPGTVIDSHIVRMPGREYILLSHTSPQGVCRPAKYCILHDDNKMSVKDFQKLTYCLCHMFSRCTQSVSYPAPTYYAHLAAKRGKMFVSGFSYHGLSNEEFRKIFSALDQLPPMYFT